MLFPTCFFNVNWVCTFPYCDNALYFPLIYQRYFKTGFKLKINRFHLESLLRLNHYLWIHSKKIYFYISLKSYTLNLLNWIMMRQIFLQIASFQTMAYIVLIFSSSLFKFIWELILYLWFFISSNRQVFIDQLIISNNRNIKIKNIYHFLSIFLYKYLYFLLFYPTLYSILLYLS